MKCNGLVVASSQLPSATPGSGTRDAEMSAQQSPAPLTTTTLFDGSASSQAEATPYTSPLAGMTAAALQCLKQWGGLVPYLLQPSLRKQHVDDV